MISINAEKAWLGDVAECHKLYRQFIRYFHGDFATIRRYYQWKRASMVKALRIGQAAHSR